MSAPAIRRLVLFAFLIGAIVTPGRHARAAGYNVDELGILKGHVGGLAYAINNDGVVVGESYDADGVAHAVRLRDGTLRDLDIADRQTFAYAAILWDEGEISNLNDVIPADSGWFLAVAYGINDGGQIVGLGYRNGEQRGFILSPAD